MQFDATIIRRWADEIRAELGDDFDLETFMDTLDGVTDAADIADRMISDMLAAEAMGEAIRSEIADLTERRDRYDARKDAFRRQLLALLDATGEKKMERPRATISRRAGFPSVHITDETAIPSQLCKTTVAPDKAAIKAQLLAGETVPGAQIVMGADGVTVRVK
jgi:hypothetical protein